MPRSPGAAIQSFHSYDQLTRLWPVRRKTIEKWVAQLRRERPDLVWVTYRLVGGHRRTAFLAGMTVAALQDLHFPRGGEQRKRRGAGLHTPGSLTRPRSRYLRERLAREQAERDAFRPAGSVAVPPSVPSPSRPLVLIPTPRPDSPRSGSSS
jgi:hypothetical protein